MMTDQIDPRAFPIFDENFRKQFEALLVWRRDVRHFKRDPLPNGLIEDLLALACLAPSVGFCQPWRFVIVEDQTKRTQIAANFLSTNGKAAEFYRDEKQELYSRLKLEGLYEAPVHLAVFSEIDPIEGAGLGRQTMPQTVSFSVVMAIHTLWLAARAQGIGMGWLSILDPVDVVSCLDVPSHWNLIGYFCLGYAQDESAIPLLEEKLWEKRSLLESVITYR